MEEHQRLVEAMVSLPRPMARPHAECFVRALPAGRVRYWLRKARRHPDATAFLVNRLVWEQVR